MNTIYIDNILLKIEFKSKQENIIHPDNILDIINLSIKNNNNLEPVFFKSKETNFQIKNNNEYILSNLILNFDIEVDIEDEYIIDYVSKLDEELSNKNFIIKLTLKKNSIISKLDLVKDL